MKPEINLIKAITKKDLVVLRLKKQGQKIATAVLALFIFSSLAVFIVLFVLGRQLSANEKTISSLKSGILKLEKNESYLITISDRIEAINLLLKNRQTYSKAIADLQSLLIPGFLPKELKIEKDGGLKIAGECSDLAFLTKYYNGAVEEVIKTGKYSQVIYPSVTRTKDGMYRLNLELKK